MGGVLPSHPTLEPTVNFFTDARLNGLGGNLVVQSLAETQGMEAFAFIPSSKNHPIK